MHVLLIDDEMDVLRFLSKMLPWEELGFEQIHIADSAQKALEICRQYALAVIITDIRMPDISGLELIRMLRTSQANVRFIVLSGYSDFDYTQEAVSLHVDAYLLKPVSDEKLIEAIRLAKEMYIKRMEEISSLESAQLALKANLPFLRENFLSQLLRGIVFSKEEFMRQTALLGLGANEGAFVTLLIVRLDSVIQDAEEGGILLQEYAISNIINSFFSPQFRICQCRGSFRQYVFWLFSDQCQALADLAANAQDAIRTVLSLSVSMALSDWGRFPEDVRSLYNKTARLLRFTTNDDSGGLVVTPEDVKQPDVEEIETLEELYRSPSLEKLLNAQQWDLADQRIDAIFSELQKPMFKSSEYRLEVWYRLTSALLYVAHNNNMFLFPIQNILQQDISPSGMSIGQMHTLIHKTLHAVQTAKDKEIGQIRTDIITQVKSFLISHLNEDVSLQHLADIMHIHPVYLSRVFKLSTNETISDFILRIKMERAAELLLQDDTKVYYIAQQVGYSSSAYFGRVFKKYYNLTPQDYRVAHENK